LSLPWHVLLKIGEKYPTLKVAWTGDRPFASLPGSGQNSYLATPPSLFLSTPRRPSPTNSRFFCLSILLVRRVPAYQHRPRQIPRNHIVRSTRLDEPHWNSAHAYCKDDVSFVGVKVAVFQNYRIIHVFRQLIPARDPYSPSERDRVLLIGVWLRMYASSIYLMAKS
jgi:hypothetical protein